jgi:hypothetical protein
MKKDYETPNVEIVKFQYGDQVVAASGGGSGCQTVYRLNDHPCKDQTEIMRNRL